MKYDKIRVDYTGTQQQQKLSVPEARPFVFGVAKSKSDVRIDPPRPSFPLA